MKKLITLIGIVFTFSAHAVSLDLRSYNGPTSDTKLINKADPSEYIKPLQTAGYINPAWGAGTGFHWVTPRYGTPYLRSNPDGQSWNNKYYKW